MSTESHERMLRILTEVDELKAKEVELQAEMKCHNDQIANAESELRRCGEEVAVIRENELGLKRELTDLRDEIFARPEEVIVEDASHVPTEDGAPVETGAHRAWKERAAHLKKVQ
jgi:hypothetical protein